MKFLIHNCFNLWILLWVAPLVAYSQQNQDTVEYSVEALQSLAQEEYSPHYIISNRFGIIDLNEKNATILRARAFSSHQLFRKGTLFLGADAIFKATFQNPHNSSVFVQQGYAAFQYDFLKLTLGKTERTVGTHAEDLSTGSLAISRNARPFPQILLSVPEYTNIPFTKGWVQFKGTFAHAWLNDERYIDNPFLHEKSLYFKVGAKYKFNIYGGLVHFVVWGGEHPSVGKISSSFRDYLRMITASSAEGIPEDNNPIIGEQLNALGDHLGIFDVGGNLKTNLFDVQVYHQMPYEDFSGTQLKRNRDRLLGIHIKENKSIKYVEELVYEYMNTTYQSGPGLTDRRTNDFDNFGYKYGGRDNYYNNYLYRTGWTYKEQILGTPLFFTETRARTYIPGFTDPDKNRFNFYIVNNRVIAHHIGLKGRVIPQLEYKLLTTTTLNYGTYGGINGGIQEWGSRTNPNQPYAFKPALRQYYFLLETTFYMQNDLSLTISGALDTGEITSNTGVMIGIIWKGQQSFRKTKQ